MHFSIKDVVTLTTESGKAYTGYEILLNGVFHSVARYRQFNALYQELLKLGFAINCTFPSKTFLSASTEDVFLRTIELQKFLQAVGSDTSLLTATPTVSFFAHTREAYISRQPYIERDVIIRLSSRWKVVSLTVGNTEATDQVLRKLLKKLSIPVDFTYAFGLFLARSISDVTATDNCIIVRQLYRFECPLISLNEANKVDVQYQLILRKCYLYPVADTVLLECEESASLLYDQALVDFHCVEAANRHFTAPIHKPLAKALISPTPDHSSPRPTHSELRTYLGWMHTNIPFYGCLHIRECKLDASQYSVSNAMASAAFVSADLWLGRDGLLISIPTETSPTLSFRTSTDSGLGIATSDKSTSDLFKLPITQIQSWQLVIPESSVGELTTPANHLLIKYSGEVNSMQSNACISPVESPCLSGELHIDPLFAVASDAASCDLELSLNLHPSADLHDLIIASDSADQIFLLNESLLQLIEETMRAGRGQQVFDTLSSRLSPNYLFPIHPDSSESQFSSSVSSLNDASGGRRNVRHSVMLKARSMSKGFKRIFSPSVPTPIINGLEPENSKSQGCSEVLLAESAEDARKLLLTDDSFAFEAPFSINLEIPEEVPVARGRLHLHIPVSGLPNDAAS